MARRAKSPALPWEYCECGCHGSELRIGNFYRWSLMTWPVVDGKNDYAHPQHHLNTGHKWGKHLGTWSSSEELNAFVRAELAQLAPDVEKQLKLIKKLAKGGGE
jgi:hypothetical protein